MNTETPIKRIKTSKVVFVAPLDTMIKVEDIFETLSIHHILVLDHDKLCGVISKSDLLTVYRNAVVAGNFPDRTSIKAKEIMTSNPVTLDVEDTIGLAADIFLTNKIHSIPVLNGNQLAGIITNHDIIKFCFR
jgi:CBS domain-containing protein